VISRVGKSILLKSVVLLSVIGLGPPSLAQADSLGKLFFTPQERATLDRFRDGTPPETPPVVPTAPSRVDGFVERSSGKNAIWINGVPEYQAQTGGSPASRSVTTPSGIVIQRSREPFPQPLPGLRKE
jgi:hypothetical protein